MLVAKFIKINYFILTHYFNITLLTNNIDETFVNSFNKDFLLS